MDYTLADAAKAAGVNRSTVLRAIKNGKLSARRLEDRSYRVEPSELARVFDLHKPLPTEPEAMPGHAQSAQSDAQAVATLVELARLRERVELLERERETNQETVSDLRKRLDRSEERVLALSAPVAQAAPQPAPEVPAVIDELRRRLEEAEARNQMLSAVVAPRWAEERPSEPLAGVTPPKGARGFLGRLLGR
jgi:molybdopterin converting factor small subunit